MSIVHAEGQELNLKIILNPNIRITVCKLMPGFERNTAGVKTFVQLLSRHQGHDQPHCPCHFDIRFRVQTLWMSEMTSIVDLIIKLS